MPVLTSAKKGKTLTVVNTANVFNFYEASRYPTTCASCTLPIDVGSPFLYRPSDRKAHHAACPIAAPKAAPHAEAAPMMQQTALHKMNNIQAPRKAEPQVSSAEIAAIKAEIFAAPQRPQQREAEYKCAKCNAVFTAMHFTDARLATGRTIQHCGTPAFWLRTIEAVPAGATLDGQAPINFDDVPDENSEQSAELQEIPDGLYTVKREDETHITFRFRTQKDDDTFAPGQQIVSTLIGQNNEGDYLQWGFVNAHTGGIAVWKSRRDRVNDWPILAHALITGDWQLAGLTYAKASGNCYICNRRLTVPESIESGIGPICAEKIGL